MFLIVALMFLIAGGTFHIALLIVAAVLFLIAGLKVSSERADLIALGLFFWVVAVLIGGR